MTDVSGDSRMSNAPQVPKHPLYRGKPAKGKRDFDKRYQDYYNTLLAFEICLNKPFVMPVTSCVDVWTKDQMLKFEMEKNTMEVTRKYLKTIFGQQESRTMEICQRSIKKCVKYGWMPRYRMQGQEYRGWKSRLQNFGSTRIAGIREMCRSETHGQMDGRCFGPTGLQEKNFEKTRNGYSHSKEEERCAFASGARSC